MPVPLPGTLVASETEDPLGPLVFDYLRLDQAGGPDPTQTLTIEIYGDGRILRNGIEATLGQEQVAQVDERLDAINFFGLQNMFVGPPGRGDEYTYTLFVRQQDRQRRINAQDGYIPLEVRQTLALIVLMGDVVPPPTPVLEVTPTATEDGA